MSKLMSFIKTLGGMNETEQKIESLKRKLKEVHEKYILDVFYILNEIYTLRKEQIPSYTLPDLSREKGIEQSIGSIRYLFGFLYMSEQSRKYLEEGKITPTLVLQVINNSTEFRKPEIQDKLISKVVKGELGSKQLSLYNQYTLLQIANDKNPMSKESKVILQTTAHLNSIGNWMRDNKEIVSKPEVQEKIRQNFRHLSRVVNETIGNGFIECPKCHHKFNVDDAYELKDSKNTKKCKK